MTEPRKHIDPDGAHLLVEGIVQQAVSDFRCSHPFSTERQEVERFFRSPYFTTLTGLNGRAILKKLNQPQGGTRKR